LFVVAIVVGSSLRPRRIDETLAKGRELVKEAKGLK
jgi:hypothetical protein